jgi:alginate O-acetyltransferase complex protein AlgI
LDGRKYTSAIGSYVFYGVWSVKFALVMFITTSVDYFTAKKIEDDPGRRRFWLVVSLVSNLGVLAIFKYANFFIDTVNAFVPRPLVPTLNVVLPIGISFYTFESMSYVIDVYRGKVRAARRIIDYVHFVTMFPRLIAGPIVRYSDMEAQLNSLRQRPGADTVMEAARFFVLGLCKKILVADIIAAHLVNPLFAEAQSLTLVTGWVAALGYTVQLYFDFSGYSDMAVGLALLMGLELPRNFNLPYAARNPVEFWRRWHISLSSWLRDYLYIPLGGNRGTWGFIARNLMITMLLGGLWHGAGWTFVLWGAWHGLGLVFMRLGPVQSVTLPKQAAVALTFLFVVIGWVMFRADSIPQAVLVYKAMTGFSGAGLGWLGVHPAIVLFLVAAVALSMWRDTYDTAILFCGRTGAMVLGLLFVVCITRLGAPSPFLYFQF